MLRAYLDESGHEGKEWVFMAGHVGTKTQWLNLIDPWDAALGQRTNFHASALRWGQPRTKRLLARLGPIPAEAGLTRVFAGVRVSDYQDLVTGTSLEKLFKGYTVCLFELLNQVLPWMPKNERLEIVFEEQHEYQVLTDYIVNLFGNKLRTPKGKPKIAKWSYLPKDSSILMHQADYLAYALTQNYRDKPTYRAAWCRPILGDLKAVGGTISRARVRTLMEGSLRTLNEKAVV